MDRTRLPPPRGAAVDLQFAVGVALDPILQMRHLVEHRLVDYGAELMVSQHANPPGVGSTGEIGRLGHFVGLRLQPEPLIEMRGHQVDARLGQFVEDFIAVHPVVPAANPMPGGSAVADAGPESAAPIHGHRLPQRPNPPQLPRRDPIRHGAGAGGRLWITGARRIVRPGRQAEDGTTQRRCDGTLQDLSSTVAG